LKFDKKSLTVKLWAYFAIFSAIILILIWLLQTVFLSNFYESMKTRTIEKAATQIAETYGSADFESTVDRLAYKNSILVYVTDLSGNLLYTSDEHGPGGDSGNGRNIRDSENTETGAHDLTRNTTTGNVPGGKNDFNNPPGGFGGQRSLPRDYSAFLQKLSESKTNAISYKINQDNFSGNTLIYGVKLSGAVLYISSPIEALDATTAILSNQLIYVTVIALLLGFVIAYFISRKLAKPITNITNTAGQLAKGDFTVKFQKGTYTEADELSETLNYMAHELSKVEALRRELIANISHDLRTPLTMIKGYTEMIEEVSADDKEKRAKHLAIINEEVTRLEELVNGILELSLLQSGNELIDLQNINLSDTVKAVLPRFESLREHNGITIQSYIELDQYVRADKARIEQVLYNLIGNAINYAGDDKTVTVTLTDHGATTRFEVKDNGAGIPQEDLPHIWDRYYKSNDRKRTGTGIGLSIVKNILELHKAGYGVESELGSGSTFWFELRK
jgi:signal transduction histidine kinase